MYNVVTIARLISNEPVKYMSSLRKFLIACALFVLTTAPARAVQINLSSDNVDQYFRILEQYVLPLMVVSTIVLFCGYLASRIFHRTVSRRQDRAAAQDPYGMEAEDNTEAFLRELKASPPIREPEPVVEPRSTRPTERQVEPESKKEPRVRAPHPLLRRRSAAGKAEKRMPEAEPAREDAPARRPFAAPPAGERSDAAQMSRLQSAFRRPDRAATDGLRSDSAAAPEPEEDDDGSLILHPIPDDALGKRTEPGAQAEEPAHRARANSFTAEADRDPEFRADRRDTRDDDDLDDIPERREPTISVVQALKATSAPKPAPADNSEARARAIEIVDSLDHVSSMLQQSSVMLAERIKNKQGLTLEDAQSLRIDGFEQPKNVLEDLRKLGGDAAEEVLNAYASAAAFNKIVVRLEQMAETAPLDEGWNELIRGRISDTIYAVGQVRKTLSIYRRVVKNPANTENNPGAAGKTPEGGAGGSVPIGRRQV